MPVDTCGLAAADHAGLEPARASTQIGAGFESMADRGNLDTKRGLRAVAASAKRSIRSAVDSPWSVSRLCAIHSGRPQSQIVDTAREPLSWIVASMRSFCRNSEPTIQFHSFRSLMSGAIILAISTDRVRLCLKAPRTVMLSVRLRSRTGAPG